MPAKKPTKSMDIQKPGDSAPDTSSRPILVTNRPMLQDPMMVSDQTPTAEKSAEEAPASAQPMASGAKTIEPEKDFAEESTKEKAPEDTPPEVVAEKTQDSLPDEKDVAAAEAAAVVDAVVATANKGSGNSETEKQADADAKRKQAVQVLVDSKKYFVPTGQVSRLQHNKQVLILLILVAVVALVFLAVTLGFIPSPIEPAKNAIQQLI